ncbi:hypothetical protein QWZ08_11100 [Ferruginibacter paludis]|uniref:hypothetical protein n=1 Tax=Ferruginibacter paludis TaxID=1310417 RepID=UPI0025B400A7|nr:hypothetical protein [Ferruginibacter paludis]MDN3656177.1 hypothetical protein [Ferruginibacter paludis]
MTYQTLIKKLTYSNRRLHIHIGLFLVLFIWLFSFSGLLLNHGNWKFASFWDERKEKTTEIVVSIPAGLDSIQIMKTIFSQLKIAGEVNNVKMTTDSVDFSVAYPGHVSNIHADFKTGTGIQKELSYNVWGKLRTLHTFNGANRGNADVEPNWLLTRVWRFSMDAIAVGLIFLSVSSWIMWYKIRQNYPWGYLVLIVGFALAGWFVILLKL